MNNSHVTTTQPADKHHTPRILTVMNLIVLVLSGLLIFFISVDTFEEVNFLENHQYMVFQFWVCIFFMIDFFVELAYTSDKLGFVKRRMAFLLLSVPYLNIINMTGMHLSGDVLYFVRFIPLARGALAMSIVIGYLSSNAVTSLFMSYLVILLMITYFCSLIFFDMVVIDDDPLQRDIVSEMLERNAVSCAVCATASDVVKAMRKRDFDLILTDINMPGTNGFALIELLRKSNIGNSRTIPIVAMTARDDDDSKPLLKRGFSGCIFKPFSMQELLERISMVMEKPMVPDDVRIDFSPLVENVTEPVKILKGLSESTSTEIAVLKKNIGHDDRNGVSAILHRIKPVWEMLGIESCLQPLRKSLWDRNSTPADIKKTAAGVITAMENLIENINEELKTIRDEEQNTDS